MKNLSFLLLGFTLTAGAQELDFGKVTKEEVLEKTHPLDSSAPAALLYKKGRTYFEYDTNKGGWFYQHEVEARVKIYKKEGYEAATLVIPFYNASDGSKERVSIQKAVTYNWVEGKIEKEKLKSEGEFEEKRNAYTSLLKITMPNIKEGSVFEYKYTLISPFITSLPDWDFQYHIPANHVEYTIEIPEYFTYKEFQRGFFNLAREQSTRNVVKNMRYEYKEAGASAIGAHRTNSSMIEYKEKVTHYTARNIPVLKEEKYVSTIENFRSSISHELSFTQYPNTPIKYYAQTWEDVSKKIYESSYFGGELNKTGYFEETINRLLAGATTNEEKIARIFNHVQTTMNWNKIYGYSCSEGVKKAYQEHTGNTADINLMLTAMLRHAGISANPVLVSTRNHGIPVFPTREGFNHVIAAVEIENGLILLDATDKASLPNLLPIRDLNWFGRLIRKEGSSAQVNLIPASPSKENASIQMKLREDGSATGKCRLQYTDYNAMLTRNEYLLNGEEAYVKDVEKKYRGIEISEFKTVNEKERSKPFQEEFSFVKDNAFDRAGNKIYLSPMLFLATTENPFKAEKREYPIDFVYPKAQKYLINIEIPAGYTVESLPKPTLIQLPEQLGVFKYNIAQDGINLQVVASVEFYQAVIPPAYYEVIKTFYTTLVEKEAEKIVLAKN